MRYKTRPYAHQERVLELSKDRQYYFLMYDMGTGKTKVTIDNATYLFDKGRIDAVLVLAPNGVHSNWVHDQLPVHCAAPHEALAWGDHGHATAVWKKKFDALVRTKKLAWLCMNIEAVRTNAGVHTAVRFLQERKVMMVVDESTCIKNIKAQQTKMAIRLARGALYRRCLTGTPMTQGPLDVYSQCQFLHPQALPYPTWTSFKSTFAIETTVTLGNRSFKKITGYANLERLRRELAPFSDRVTKEECLDLPEKIYQTRRVPLTPEQLRHYSTMKELFVVQLEKKEREGIITVDSVLTSMIKLQQVVCGFIKDEHGTCHDIPNNRDNALLEHIDSVLEGDPQAKFIIWCGFVHNIHRIGGLLTAKYGDGSLCAYHGETPQARRPDLVRDFQTNPQARFFVSNETGAEGITLHAANHVIYYSNTYKLRVRQQSEDRAHRIGQKKHVLYLDLMTPSTTDERIIRSLKSKADLAETVLRNWRELL